MDNYVGSTNTSYVITNKCEFFGIACLAVIGIASIVSSIYSTAYKLGRDTKEIEMKREFKKYQKELEKQEKKEQKEKKKRRKWLF
jgi:uncharacterized membrane protein (DUF106 family)